MLDDHRRSLSMPVSGGVDVLRDALDVLRDAGTKVDDAGLRRPTLDDVFLTLTGSPPSAGDGSDGVAAAEPAGTQVTG